MRRIVKVRHICAILGVAIAVGTVVFLQGLVATNDHQAVAIAERLLKKVPVAADAKVAQFTIDYRPNGHVMQGPPMMACVAAGIGDWGSGIRVGECVVTKAMFAQRKLPVPPVGTELTLIGRKKTHCLKIAAVIDWEKPLRGYPNAFVSGETAQLIDEEWRGWEPKTAEELAPGFMSDAGRNFDRAKVLLLWAAALTALCLLVNSLVLTIEAKRKEIAILRMIGLTRGGVAKRVTVESAQLTLSGVVVGVLGAVGALFAYVACDGASYPMGVAIPLRHFAKCLCVAPVVAVVAALVALRPALKVKPLEAASNRMPRKRQLGMLIAFACGFGAFVAVEGMEFGSAMHALSSNERRPLRFTLLYWDRNKEEKIFLRVTDPAAEDRIVSFVTLGNVVRVKEPTLAFGDDDTATVVQQVSRDHYTRTRISFARNGAATIVGRDENILSDDAVSEQIATRAVADRLLEADSKRKDNGKGGFFSRHKTRTVQEPKLTSGTDVKTREK